MMLPISYFLFSVVAVDSSLAAIEAARNNVRLNSDILNAGKAQFYAEDAIKYMERAVENGEEYDIVICDPPKLSPNLKSLGAAKEKCELNHIMLLLSHSKSISNNKISYYIIFQVCCDKRTGNEISEEIGRTSV